MQSILCNNLSLSYCIYGVTVWGNTPVTYLEGTHKLQKKFARLATYNELIIYNDNTPILHPSLPLFQQLNIINIFDIFKLHSGLFSSVSFARQT